MGVIEIGIAWSNNWIGCCPVTEANGGNKFALIEPCCLKGILYVRYWRWRWRWYR